MVMNVHVFSPSQLKTEHLPLLSVIFVTENSVVAAVGAPFPPKAARLWKKIIILIRLFE
jgi:hypothetical protein